ncbi:MAG: hypothetical protein ACYSSI_05760, partial [Planctomycetota bacterium]
MARYLVYLLLGALLFSIPAQADFVTVFTEDWESETVGDNANQLADWQYEANYGNGIASDVVIASSAEFG